MKIFLVIKCSYSLTPPLEIYTKKMISKAKHQLYRLLEKPHNLHFYPVPTGSSTLLPQHNSFSTQQLE